MAAARDGRFNVQVLVRAATACLRIGTRIKEGQTAIGFSVAMFPQGLQSERADEALP
jgi:hypothetical protein